MNLADLSIFQLIFAIVIAVSATSGTILMRRHAKRTRNKKLRRRSYFVLIFGIFVSIVLAFPAIAFLYTEHLWFESVGYDNIFWKLIKMRWGLFLKFALIAIAFMIGNFLIADRLCPISSHFARWTRSRTFQFYTSLLISIVFAGLLLGVPMMFLWDDFLRYENHLDVFREMPTIAIEPIYFQKPIGFFLFSFPIHRILSLWTKALMWTNLTFVIILYNFFYKRDPQSMTRVEHRFVFHGTILWLILFAVSIWRNQFNIWNTLYTRRTPWGNGRVEGLGFVDGKLITAYQIYTFCLIAIAVLIVINLIWRKRPIWYIAGFSWLISYLLLMQAYPIFIHVTQVRPNPLTAEVPFLEKHIGSTRSAFGLDRVEIRHEVRGPATLEQINRNPEVKSNIQLWDRRVLYDVFTEHPQKLKPFFRFHPYTDVDRYWVDGEYRQVLIAAREIDPSLLEEAEDWVNRKLIYTHGYGVCVVPVNEFDNKDPNFWVKAIATDVEADLWKHKSVHEELEIKRPEIYFGELTRDYVIVNSQQDEIDLERRQYAGVAGVQIGGWFRRFCFALRFDFWRILLSTDLTHESRILFWRKIGTREPNSLKIRLDRISHIAPFLKYDPDPYIVIGDDGKLYWIVDLYVTSVNYPNAKIFEDDKTLVENDLYAEPTFDRYNYLRNPAVAIVDAYDGSVNFYFTKVNEPIALAYQNAFPNLFKSRDEIPAGLEDHLRYPDYLTRVQSEMYRQYHVTDGRIFYQGSDLWEIPVEKYYSEFQPISPYYATIKLPGEDQLEFVNMMPFTPPAQVEYMKAWFVARSDYENYGELIVYAMPKDETIPSPRLVEGTIETKLSKDLTLWGQRGTKVIRGNLLVIPVEDALFYVEPIYLQAENINRPDLKVVAVQAGEEFAYADSFDGALRNIAVGTTSAESSGPKTLEELIQSAKRSYDQYFDLTSKKEFEKASEALEALDKSLKSLSDGDYEIP